MKDHLSIPRSRIYSSRTLLEEYLVCLQGWQNMLLTVASALLVVLVVVEAFLALVVDLDLSGGIVIRYAIGNLLNSQVYAIPEQPKWKLGISVAHVSYSF